MRRINTVLLAVVLALVPVHAFAQAKPNFAGTWARETPFDPSDRELVGWGWEPTITQTATSINIKWLVGRDSSGRFVYYSRTYNLTGESKNPVYGRGGVPTKEVTTTVSTWEHGKLVLTTGLYKEVISIESGKLVFERTIRGPGGKPAPATTKIVYKKKS